SHRALSEHKTLSISWSHYPIINGLDQDGENFIFGVDISYALYHALCRCQRERMNGIFMY
ncbi:hypothetical protein, partial [Escherichia coli]|uniref:hypothetical protein n=1 Tax=Escherichia coli TaxID=562 RepID=UPI001BC839A4